MMLRQASFGFGSSERKNCLPDSEARKTSRLSGELTRTRSLSCAAACDRATRYWRTALKISQVTHAPVPNTAKMASCCLSNGYFLSKSITPKEGRGKQQFYERGAVCSLAADSRSSILPSIILNIRGLMPQECAGCVPLLRWCGCFQQAQFIPHTRPRFPSPSCATRTSFSLP